MKNISLKTTAFVTSMFMVASAFAPTAALAERNDTHANAQASFELHLGAQAGSEDKSDTNGFLHLENMLQFGAGKSGKVPPGLEHAKGVQEKLDGENNDEHGKGHEKDHGDKNPDTKAPMIVGPFAFRVTDSSARVIYFTSESANGAVYYSTESGVTVAPSTAHVSSSDKSFFHEFELTGLTSATKYYYVVTSTDASGNTNTSAERSFKTDAATDETAPALSDVSAHATSATTAVVTWTTNEPARSRVFYATDTGVSTNNEALSVHSNLLVENHTMTLSDLSASTTYYFFVRSRDASGNASSSSEFHFTTPAM